MPLSIRHSIFKTAFGCATILLLLTGVGMAQTKTESFTTTAPLKSSSAANDFLLPSFNTALGTLESVNLTLTFRGCAHVRVLNDGNTPTGFTDASITMPIAVTGPDDLDLNTSLSAFLASGSAKPGLNSFWVKTKPATDKQQVDPSAFNFWENQPGDEVSLSVTKDNLTFQGTDLGNDLFFGGWAGEHGKITVQYTYLATPEPSGKYFSAIVAAAMTLMLMGRKKLLRA